MRPAGRNLAVSRNMGELRAPLVRVTHRSSCGCPGGLWQISGRSDLAFGEAVRLDNWSMLEDLTILARTLGAVLGTKGAC